MKSLKSMPENIETMTDSVRCFENFDHWGDDYRHKRAFSLVEKCRVTSWRSEGQPIGTGDDFLIRLSRNPIWRPDLFVDLLACVAGGIV